jgi:hypothetical protein
MALMLFFTAAILHDEMQQVEAKHRQDGGKYRCLIAQGCTIDSHRPSVVRAGEKPRRRIDQRTTTNATDGNAGH